MTKAKDKQSKQQADKATHKTRQEIDSADERGDRRPDEPATPPPAPQKKSAPHLIDDGDVKRCSVCGYSFYVDPETSIEEAFSEHLRKAHRPGQTTEDVNQAAFRIVRQATER
jgi:hypothetical protein